MRSSECGSAGGAVVHKQRSMIEPWALGMLLKIISARSKCICTTGGRSDDVDCEDIAH